MVLVRAAELADVPAMSAVLIASITELCVADHKGDADIIAGWTRNKSPDMVGKMLANPKLRLIVAVVEGQVAGVGAVAGVDEVALNYVSPDFRLRGVSRALLADLEARMADAGTAIGRLTSTFTAHEFCRRAGWVDDDRLDPGHAVDGYPMSKVL